ncbi:DNA-binding domain superfamily [Sesbania bispinosa]|nr:DNA-binding domain superfamily [Sesbania bispinosa]
MEEQYKGKKQDKLKETRGRKKLGTEVSGGDRGVTEEAARAYDQAAFNLRGHVALLNFPNEYHSQVKDYPSIWYHPLPLQFFIMSVAAAPLVNKGGKFLSLSIWMTRCWRSFLSHKRKREERLIEY